MLQVWILLCAIAVFSLFLLYTAGWLDSPVKWVFTLLLLIGAFYLRGVCLSYETLDYKDFLHRWVEYFRNYGGFALMKRQVGNYNIPYLYFIALISYADTPDLYLIKLFTIFFEPLMAFAAADIAFRSNTQAARYPLAMFFVILFLPTVILNGSLWGQCDAIHTSLALLGVSAALKDRPRESMVLAALSFGFKLQAVFILPVYALLILRGDIRFKHIVWFPVTYVLLVLPAVLLGRPFIETITLYFSQTGSIGSGLNYNSSSIYSILTNFTDEKAAAAAGIAAAFAFMCLILAVCSFCYKRLSYPVVVSAMLLFSLGIPFFLPHMHDRYFFAADIISVVFAFLCPVGIAGPVLVQIGSLLGYHAYLKMRYFCPVRYGGYIMIAALVISFAVFTTELILAGSDETVTESEQTE